jgi:hypothetical protein
MLRNSCVAAQLAASQEAEIQYYSQEGLSSMELVSYLVS